MFPTTKVNCFIFACSHPSSVKKLDVQNRNTITYIRSDRFKSRMTNIRLSLSFLHWKKQNEFHLSFCSGHSEFIFFLHSGRNFARGWCVRRKKSMVKSREFIEINFFCLFSRYEREIKRTESAERQESSRKFIPIWQ